MMNTTSSHQVYKILPLVRNQKIVIPKPKLALVENRNRNILITRFVSYTKNTYITVRLLSLTQEAEILCRDLESGNNVTIQLQVIPPEKVLQVFPGETDEVEFPIKFKMPKYGNSIELDELICDHIVNRVNPVIWLSGAPGCGKSVLAGRIIERLNSGEFNTVSDYYKEVYAIKLSVHDYIASSAHHLKKKIASKIDDEYRKFKEKSKCTDNGECGFVVIFDEIDFVINVDKILVIFEVAMERLTSASAAKISAVVFVDIFPFGIREERLGDTMKIIANNVHEFVVPDSLSNNQFNSVLDEFPLEERVKEDIRNRVTMTCRGHPLLSMDLLRRVLVDSYHGYEINFDNYIDNMEIAVNYLLKEKTIRKAYASSPRPTQEHIELLRRIARRNWCTSDLNDSVIRLFKSLDVIEECAQHDGFRIKSPIIKRFLKNNRTTY